jgi:hypothetical protein
MNAALKPVKPREQRKSQWREVPGVVLLSEVRHSDEYYEPIVRYEYEVDGVTYQSESIVKGLVGVNWKAPAARWVRRFPAGAAVSVFVDSQEPAKCFLQLGWDPLFPYAVAFFGAIIGLFIYVLAF